VIDTNAPVSKVALWTGRVISALPVLMLLFSAAMKFAQPEGMAQGFKELGWPMRYAVGLGILETACAIIYAIPQTAVLGAILVTGYLGGATATHLRVSQPAFLAPPVLGALAWLGLLLREPRLRGLLPFRTSSRPAVEIAAPASIGV
jgi:hypothetical protein